MVFKDYMVIEEENQEYDSSKSMEENVSRRKKVINSENTADRCWQVLTESYIVYFVFIMNTNHKKSPWHLLEEKTQTYDKMS